MHYCKHTFILTSLTLPLLVVLVGLLVLVLVVLAGLLVLVVLAGLLVLVVLAGLLVVLLASVSALTLYNARQVPYNEACWLDTIYLYTCQQRI